MVLRNIIAFNEIIIVIIITPGLKALTAKRVWSRNEHVQDEDCVAGHTSLLHSFTRHTFAQNSETGEQKRATGRIMTNYDVKYRVTRTAVVKRRYRAADMHVHLSISGRAHLLSVYRCMCNSVEMTATLPTDRRSPVVVTTDKNTPTKFCCDRKCAEIATVKPANYLRGTLQSDNNGIIARLVRRIA